LPPSPFPIGTGVIPTILARERGRARPRATSLLWPAPAAFAARRAGPVSRDSSPTMLLGRLSSASRTARWRRALIACRRASARRALLHNDSPACGLSAELLAPRRSRPFSTPRTTPQPRAAAAATSLGISSSMPRDDVRARFAWTGCRSRSAAPLLAPGVRALEDASIMPLHEEDAAARYPAQRVRAGRCDAGILRARQKIDFGRSGKIGASRPRDLRLSWWPSAASWRAAPPQCFRITGVCSEARPPDRAHEAGELAALGVRQDDGRRLVDPRQHGVEPAPDCPPGSAADAADITAAPSIAANHVVAIPRSDTNTQPPLRCELTRHMAGFSPPWSLILSVRERHGPMTPARRIPRRLDHQGRLVGLCTTPSHLGSLGPSLLAQATGPLPRPARFSDA